MGFPFLTGFYSKDVILELTYAKYTFSSGFAYWLGLISAFFTSFYSFRLLYLTFWTDTNGFKRVILNAHESSLLMCISLFVLSLGSIFIGYITKDMFIGLGTNFWSTAIFNLSENIVSLNGEFMPYHIKLLPLYFSFLGSFFIIYNNYLFLNNNFFKISLSLKWLYTFLIKKWYFDIIYNKFIVLNVLSLGFFTFKEIDRGFIEIMGPLGIVRTLKKIVTKVNVLQSSFVYHYVFLIVIGATFFLTFIGILNACDYTIDVRFYIICVFIIFFMVNTKYFKINK